jgi:hypothetical protein
VHRRQAQRHRVLAEGDVVTALGGTAADLGGGEFDVPQRHHGERDESGVSGTGTPLVDHPVVVDLHAQERELLVLALEERLTAEAGKDVREADRDLDVVGVHVGQSLHLVVATGEDVVVGARFVLHHLGADGGRETCERVDEVVVVPDVAVDTVGVVDLE